MSLPDVEYLQNQISKHISTYFNVDGKELFETGYIRFLPYRKAVATRDKVIAIPFDIPVPKELEKVYRVKFNNTELTLWNRIDSPPGGEWECIPDNTSPLWYRNKQGTLIPTWNLFGNLFHLLTFGEENDSALKDSHERFAAAFSPRKNDNLLEVPAFNEAVAAIVAAYAGIKNNGEPLFNLEGLLKAPLISLSHDCDVIRGNDFWTQAVRGVRIFLPLKKFRLPAVKNVWWILRNAVTPRRFYYDNVTGMIDLERCYGYNSTFYIINGSGGRFGARSGVKITGELMKEIPDGWDMGMHYNYDTYLNDQKFRSQLGQLNELSNSEFTLGRAHYLKFDPERSFVFLKEHGIHLDESSGYADTIGYRNGIAGCFQAYDTVAKKTLDIWEFPLTIMDATLVVQYGKKAVDKFSRLLNHLGCVGGALSINFHPGQFFNPEHNQMLGVYHSMLIESYAMGAKSVNARSLAD